MRDATLVELTALVNSGSEDERRDSITELGKRALRDGMSELICAGVKDVLLSVILSDDYDSASIKQACWALSQYGRILREREREVQEIIEKIRISKDEDIVYCLLVLMSASAADCAALKAAIRYLQKDKSNIDTACSRWKALHERNISLVLRMLEEVDMTKISISEQTVYS